MQHVGESVDAVVIEGHVGHGHFDGVVFPVDFGVVFPVDLGVVLVEGFPVDEAFEEPLEHAKKGLH